jgi:hypothetical protein
MEGVRLNKQKAYEVMFDFLDSIYDATQNDSLGGILGSMRLLVDGRPADPAYWSDWEDAIGKTLLHESGNGEQVKLNREENYIAMLYFLDNLFDLTKDEGLATLVRSLRLSLSGRRADPNYWPDWEKSIKKILSHESNEG